MIHVLLRLGSISVTMCDWFLRTQRCWQFISQHATKRFKKLKLILVMVSSHMNKIINRFCWYIRVHDWGYRSNLRSSHINSQGNHCKNFLTKLTAEEAQKAHFLLFQSLSVTFRFWWKRLWKQRLLRWTVLKSAIHLLRVLD